MEAVLTLTIVMDVLFINGQEYFNENTSKYRLYSAVVHKEVKITRRDQLPRVQPHRLPIELLEPDLAQRIFQGVHNPLKRTTIRSVVTATSAPSVRFRRALSHTQTVQNLSPNDTHSEEAKNLSDFNTSTNSFQVIDEVKDLIAASPDVNSTTTTVHSDVGDDEDDVNEYISISDDFYTAEENFIHESTPKPFGPITMNTVAPQLTTSVTYPTLVVVDPEFHIRKPIKNPFLLELSATEVPHYTDADMITDSGIEVNRNAAADASNETGKLSQTVGTRHEGTFSKVSLVIPSTKILAMATSPLPPLLVSTFATATTGSKISRAQRVTRTSTVSPYAIIGGTKLPPSNRISLQRNANEPLSDLQRLVAKKLDAENKQLLRNLIGKKARIISQLIRRKLIEKQLQFIRDDYFGPDPARPSRKILSRETRVRTGPSVDLIAAEQEGRRLSRLQFKIRGLSHIRRSKRNIAHLPDDLQPNVARSSAVDGDVHVPTSPTTTAENSNRQIYVDHLERQSANRDDSRLKLIPHLVATDEFGGSRKKIRAGPLLINVVKIIKTTKQRHSATKRDENEKRLRASDAGAATDQEVSQFSRIPQSNHLLPPAEKLGAAKKPVSETRFIILDGGNAEESLENISPKAAFLGGGFVGNGLSIKKERSEEKTTLKTKINNRGSQSKTHRIHPFSPPSKSKEETAYVLRNEVRITIDEAEQAEIKPNKSRDIAFVDEDLLLHDEKQTTSIRNAKNSGWRNTIRIFDNEGTTKIWNSATVAPLTGNKSLLQRQNSSRHYVPLPNEPEMARQPPSEHALNHGVNKLLHQSSESTEAQHARRRDVGKMLGNTPAVVAWKDIETSTALRQLPAQISTSWNQDRNLEQSAQAQQQQNQIPQLQLHVQQPWQQRQALFQYVRSENGLLPIGFPPVSRTTAAPRSVPLSYSVLPVETIIIDQTGKTRNHMGARKPKSLKSGEVRGRPSVVQQAPRSKKPSSNFIRRLLLALHQK